MLNDQVLKDGGYQLFKDQFRRSKELTDSQDAYKGTWQKCIRDNEGKKYFINIEKWDFANSCFADRNLGRVPSFGANAQLTMANGDNFNVEYLSVGDKTLVEIEAWFEKQWKLNECNHYEKYE